LGNLGEDEDGAEKREGNGVEVKREDVGAPEFEFRAWVWVAHLTLKLSSRMIHLQRWQWTLVLSRGPIRRRRMEG
jgi:hypothetical protein